MERTEETKKISAMAELFKLFGDESRLRILFALKEQELCVDELAETLSMSQSAVSHQLRILKGGKLVQGSRDGKRIIYSLADDHVYTIIAQGTEHVEESM
ncbi:MAG: metalloregulator ArsR/SmtB family transcription factor [Lachnospiraceae bacterium]|nr:metalloregulator ArsR/SmtB family transcription factor [Lachnospiraceae bacterium]